MPWTPSLHVGGAQIASSVRLVDMEVDSEGASGGNGPPAVAAVAAVPPAAAAAAAIPTGLGTQAASIETGSGGDREMEDVQMEQQEGPSSAPSGRARPVPPRRGSGRKGQQVTFESWKSMNPMYDNLAYALDDYLPPGQKKEAILEEFFEFISGSPALCLKQPGTGTEGTAGLPAYAILWLQQRFKVQGYGSDTSSDALESTRQRRSSRRRQRPDPERMYGSRPLTSPGGGIG